MALTTRNLVRSEPDAALAVEGTLGRLLSWLTPLLALAAVAVLGAFRLEVYPRTWFDEGLNLLAARTLAETGRFALPSADGLSDFDIGLGTGPTVIVPIALLFKYLGASLFMARLVPLLYLLLAAGGLYVVARQNFGRSVGVLAVLIFASLSTTGPLVFGREVLGDVPALAYLFWGAAALGRASSGHDRWWFVSGLVFGLAVLTKHQIGVVLVAIVVAAVAARIFDPRFAMSRWLLLLVGAAIPTSLWFGYELALMGLPWFVHHIQELYGEAGASLKIAPLRRAPAAIAELIGSGFTTWGLVGLLFFWLLAIRERWYTSPQRLILPIFATLWLGWFVFLSIGWARYAMPAVAICSLFGAKLMHDLAQRYTPIAELRRLDGRAVRAAWENPLGTSLLVLLASAILSGLAWNGLTLARADDRSPQEFAALVRQNVEHGAVVESSEWEIDFLAQGAYHHPPARVIIESIGAVFLNQPSRLVQEYEVPATTSYLIEGPYSRLSGVYRRARDTEPGRFTSVAQAGEYELLRRGP